MNLRRVTTVLFATLALSGATRARAAISAIAAARALPAGSVVSIRGTVTVPAGSFASSTFDQGFGLQDATGGIYITMPDNAGLTAGRHVRVTGTLGDDGYGLVVLRMCVGLPAQPIRHLCPQRLVRSARLPKGCCWT